MMTRMKKCHAERHDTEPMPLARGEYEAWAVWNRCQGVFPCSIYRTRAEAAETVTDDDYAQGMRVVPVVVTVADPADWGILHLREDENERFERTANA